MSEVDLIVAILSHPAGYSLSLFGMLGIRTTDQETVEVEWEKYRVEGEYNKSKLCVKSFPHAQLVAAVKFFIKKRKALQLGLDFETELNR